ncbi:MAG TPA: winged helix-turn-helix domain-containing protein [Candidatus Acidoferrum sp.]|nr:winged helix-turn-helix domain-containing protein [Candidatus Acidoferrum sp.]
MDTQGIQAPTSKAYNPASTTPASLASRFLRFGAFYLDLQREALFKDGARIKLQGKVYQALVVLIEHAGEIVTREALRMRLWPTGTYVNYDANVNTTVNKLRQILGDSAEQPVFVDTIPRLGYSFVAKIEFLNQALTPLEMREKETVSNPSPESSPQGRLSFLRSSFNPTLLTAGIVALLMFGMLLGAGLVLYAHR